MARKALIEKEKKRQKMTERTLAKRTELKKIVKSLEASYEDKLEAMRKLGKLPKNSSPIRQRNRCLLTGRPRGYMRKFRLSRIAFRELCHEGKIPGITKSSW